MKYITIIALFFTSFSFALLTDVDSLFRGKEYKPSFDSATRSDAGTYGKLIDNNSAKNSKDVSVYALQFDAIADFNAADRRKTELSSKTGLSIQLVFDAPFYKLRSSAYTKDKAEDKARSLTASGFSVLIVKVR